MIYLDERIYATVEFSNAISTEGLYQYSIFDNESASVNIFIGNLYLEKGLKTKTVDITDIARNYCVGKNKIITLVVGVKVGDDENEGYTDHIVPIYRYPNAKADDNDYNFGTTTYTYDTILVSGKEKVKSFFYSDSLLPTYPKRVTDKISIDYLYGVGKYGGKSVFTFDYGPTYSVSNTANNTPTLYELNYPLALGSAEDKDPYNGDWMYEWSTFGPDPSTYFSFVNNKNYINYQLQTTVPIDEIYWQFAGGTNDYATPTTYPYSLTITDTDKSEEGDYICELYVNNTEVGDLLGTYPTVYGGNYTSEVKCDITEELSTLVSKDIEWSGWTYKQLSPLYFWSCNEWSNLQIGDDINVVFKGEGDFIAIDKTFTYSKSEKSFTWEWDQTEMTIVSATLNFNNGEYTTEIPLEIVNRQTDDDADYKNLIFTIGANSAGEPTLYINYSNYTINIAYNTKLTRDGVVDLADTISVYRSTKYNFTQTDNDYTFEVDGDLEINEQGQVVNTALCKTWNMFLYQNGIAVRQSATNGNYSYIGLSRDIIGDSYFLIQYTDTEGGFHEGKVWVKPTNPNSNAYYYTTFSLIYNTNYTFGCSLSQSGYKRFGKATDNSTVIGKLTCPSGYFVLWQDRLGSQQCQPFDKVDTYSEDIDGSEITNYWGKRSLYKVEVQPKWKVQTGWVSDDAYRCYEGLFVSPWVKLYDADSDILYDVIIKDRDYTEKTFLNQGKQFKLSLTLEQTEKQSILF